MGESSRSRTVLFALGATVVLTSTVLSPQASAARPHIAPAVQLLARDFPDPGVFVAGDGTYYAYATSSADFDSTIPFATAPAPGGPWQVRGDALPARPAWAVAGQGFWAPEVTRRDDGRYLMYFSAPTDTSATHMCLGAAVADSPAGPFAPAGDAPLECRDGQGDIDPNGFADTDGTRYLLYKSEATESAPATLWLQHVEADGMTPVGDRHELVHADRPDEDRGVVEAPTLIKRGAKYVLFYAEGVFDQEYKTSYAWSVSLKGGWRKACQPLLTSATFGGRVDGPGGADVTPADPDHVFFHGWLDGARARRGYYVTKLTWSHDLPSVG